MQEIFKIRRRKKNFQVEENGLIYTISLCIFLSTQLWNRIFNILYGRRGPQIAHESQNVALPKASILSIISHRNLKM